MNKQHPTKGIGWCTHTWNPIKGECPVGCWYCYARAIYQRFDWLNEGTVPESGIPGMIDEHELEAPLRLKKPSKIFVCSTYEIFYQKHHSWRDGIFDVINACPQHTFQILTKLPENIDRPMPDNVWLGVSCDGGPDDFYRLARLGEIKARVRFASYEPLLGGSITGVPFLNWGIIGRLTGHGKKYDPKKEWIIELIEGMTVNNASVFLKNNLIPIMGAEYVMKYRSFPKE